MLVVEPQGTGCKRTGEFADAVNYAGFQKLIDRNANGRIIKWHRPPILVFKSALPPSVKQNEKGKASTPEGAPRYQSLVQAIAKTVADQIYGFEPRVIRDTSRINFSRDNTLSFLFAPRDSHKHIALSAGFTEDPLSQDSFSVFAIHPFNREGELKMVLVCIDPTGMTEVELGHVLEGCMLRALGVGLTSTPATKIASILSTADFGKSRVGMTELDKRMLRTLYNVGDQADEKFVREGFRAANVLRH